MKIDILCEKGDEKELGLRGVLDREGSRKLELFLRGRDDLLSSRLIMDFSAVDFIGTSAIVFLQGIWKEVNSRGGEMVLRNLSPLLRGVLESVPDSPGWIMQNPDQDKEKPDSGS